jgi:hypothetical protein
VTEWSSRFDLAQNGEDGCFFGCDESSQEPCAWPEILIGKFFAIGKEIARYSIDITVHRER